MPRYTEVHSSANFTKKQADEYLKKLVIEQGQVACYELYQGKVYFYVFNNKKAMQAFMTS